VKISRHHYEESRKSFEYAVLILSKPPMVTILKQPPLNNPRRRHAHAMQILLLVMLPTQGLLNTSNASLSKAHRAKQRENSQSPV
jgi:hypothetical protein